MRVHDARRWIGSFGASRHAVEWRAATLGCALTVGMLLSVVAFGDEFDDVEVRATPIRNGLYMLTGAGGNILVATGADGVIVIDDQYAPLAPKVRAAIGLVTAAPIRWVVNTHWHTDHTGGNAAMAGQGAVIVAHDNVRVRMAKPQFIAAFQQHVAAAPKEAWPIVTFSESMTFHWNGDEVRIVHAPASHTDGDAFVRFESADVVHAGDVFFAGMYPFFDSSSGGGFAGMIAATDRLLELVGEETLIVPGHGPLSRRRDLLEYRQMLGEVQRSVAAGIRDGRTREEIVDAKPTRHLDGRFGGGFMKPASFVALVYESLKPRPAP